MVVIGQLAKQGRASVASGIVPLLLDDGVAGGDIGAEELLIDGLGGPRGTDSADDGDATLVADGELAFGDSSAIGARGEAGNVDAIPGDGGEPLELGLEGVVVEVHTGFGVLDSLSENNSRSCVAFENSTLG